MNAKESGSKAIRIGNSIVNIIVLTIVVVLVAFAAYALWDSEQIFQSADKSHYAVYKPTVENEGKSFKELQAINPEVLAWLNVYGTNIDYPVAQGTNNLKYVNTNVEGDYALTGAIFLDCANSKDFSDFNNILYGHHMQKKAMFGEIGDFSDKSFFDSHRYGNLYFGGKDHGLEFFAFAHVDAYNISVFAPGVKGTQRQTYLDNLLTTATHKRDVGVTVEDHIIMLSTCSSSSTNGRDILIGRISNKVFEDSFINMKTTDERVQLTVDSHDSLLKVFIQLLPVFMLALAALMIVLMLVIIWRKKRTKDEQEGRTDS